MTWRSFPTGLLITKVYYVLGHAPILISGDLLGWYSINTVQLTLHRYHLRSRHNVVVERSAFLLRIRSSRVQFSAREWLSCSSWFSSVPQCLFFVVSLSPSRPALRGFPQSLMANAEEVSQVRLQDGFVSNPLEFNQTFDAIVWPTASVAN
jgi:hypothetical protein